MTKNRQKYTGKHTRAALEKWLAELTAWFDRHPKRNHRFVRLPANLSWALLTSGLVTRSLNGTGFPGEVGQEPAPPGVPMSLFARRPDPVSGKATPDLLLLGAGVKAPPTAPPGMDPALAAEQGGAAMWALCEAANANGIALRQALQEITEHQRSFKRS